MEELTYKQATLSNYDDFYIIKCDPENVKWSGFASAPDYERMKEWFCKQLDSEKRTIYIAYWNGVACGFFYLDKETEEEFEAASSGVLKEFTGRGIGSAIIRYATEVSNAFVLCAWVSDKNRASERYFEKNGFDKLAAKEQRMMSSGNALYDFLLGKSD